MTAKLILKDVKIFDGETQLHRGYVVVNDHGLIEDVGSGDPPNVLEGTTISKPGHTLMPGLIDGHIHADGGNEIALPQSLRFGVTTVCDMGNDPQYIRKLFRQIKSEGDGVCADLKTCQYSATVDGGWPMSVILAFDKSEKTRNDLAQWPKLVTPEDGRKYVNAMLRELGGLDYVKLLHESGSCVGFELPKPSVELQRAIVEEGHRHGLKVVAHATCLADTIEILEAGVDGTTHTIADQPPNDRLIEAYKKNNAHCNPTLAAIGSLTSEGLEMQEKYATDPRVMPLLSDRSKESMHACMGFYKSVADSTAKNAYESVRKLHKAGIDIICGSDAAGPSMGTAWGLSVHQELALFVKHCDFTPIEALRSATSVVAKRLDLQDRGILQHGKRADLLLVEGDPTTDIDHTLNIRGVWKKGVFALAHSSNQEKGQNWQAIVFDKEMSSLQ